jgi:cob(I)alamin adenosyltransferase
MSAQLSFDPAELRWRASRCGALAAEVDGFGETWQGQVPTGQPSAAAAHIVRSAAQRATAAMARWLRATGRKVSGYTAVVLAHEEQSAAKLRAVHPKVG